MTKSIIMLLVFAITASVASASDFAGEFQDELGTGAKLTLKSGGDGEYSGTLSMDGFDVPVTGAVEGDVLAGEMDDGMMAIAFSARLVGDKITMDLMVPDFPGEVMDSLQFVRAGAKSATPAATTATGDVVINGNKLSEEQVAQLVQTYGVAPLPGEYWYDAVSGLYGAVGYQAFGFMYPGHEFGELQRDVSRGDTSVFVNGRELPQSEWVIWSYMLGAPIQMGAYWLDAQGNAGYVGNPIPTVNLFMAAMQNSYQGQGGGGDNFWSSRFSAGNSNADNTQGYVSVPGHGPVGYGF